MTAGTRRNGTSKFGSFKRAATAPFGGSEGQAQDGPAFTEVFGHDEYGDLSIDDPGAYAEDGAYGYEEPVTPAGPAVDVGDPVQAGQDAEPGRNGKHYAGRHASPRGKTTRKRVGRVVPVAAVAATLAAGTAAAAYGLGGGHSQAAHLNDAMSAGSGNIAAARASSAGNANAANSGLIKVAKATDGSARATAKAAPKATPSAKPTAAATPAAATSAPAATTKAPAAAPATSKSAAATTLSCNLSYSMLPDNVTAIVSFLLANGYSDNAAAGIAGNMYQESKGDPESEGMGGGGLIGFTPLPAGYVTGNPATDLQTQLNAVLTYNQGWASYLPALNAAASPADAAYIYVTDFERAGIPAASTREASADNVASACGI